MKQGSRTIRYDEQLHLEAYSFEGVAQSFPQHFHAYYVWGYAAQGERLLTCCGKQLTLAAAVILREPFTVTTAAGTALAMAGLFISNYKS